MSFDFDQDCNVFTHCVGDSKNNAGIVWSYIEHGRPGFNIPHKKSSDIISKKEKISGEQPYLHPDTVRVFEPAEIAKRKTASSA